MKTFNVQIYFHGNYNVNIKARNKEEALEKANDQIENMDNLAFLQAINIQDDGYDVREL